MARIRSVPAGAALTVELLSAYLANNTVAPQNLPDLIRTTRLALIGEKMLELDEKEPAPIPPAVSARTSLASSAHILSMIDGKPYRTLRRHLTAHGLTPESYKARYNLPEHYPMVAADYSAYRRMLARKMELGKRQPARDPSTHQTAQALQHRSNESVVVDVRPLEPTRVDSDANEPRSAGQKSKASEIRRHRRTGAIIPHAQPVQTEKTPKHRVKALEAAAGQLPNDVAVAGMSPSQGRVTDKLPRRSKLILFAGSSEKAEARAPQSATGMSTREPRSEADLDGSSLFSTPAAADKGQRKMVASPSKLSARCEQEGLVARDPSLRLTLMEAVTRKRAVTALYNGVMIKLAPHQVFERHGDLFLTALNLGKHWRAYEERRLGQFKFAGLKHVRLLDEAIAILPSFDGSLPRPDDRLILSIREGISTDALDSSQQGT